MIKTLQEKLDELIKNIPYEEIREHAFKRLNDAKLLNGSGQDTRFMILENIDIFRSQYLKAIKQVAWDHVFRQIRKTLAHDINEWTQRKVSEEYMKRELELIDIGGAG